MKKFKSDSENWEEKMGSCEKILDRKLGVKILVGKREKKNSVVKKF